MIELTKKEADVLIELIELNLFDIIRKDEEIDSIEWLETIMSIYEKCKGNTNRRLVCRAEIVKTDI